MNRTPETDAIGRDLRRYIDAVLGEGEPAALPGDLPPTPRRRAALAYRLAAAVVLVVALVGIGVVVQRDDSGTEVATEGPSSSEGPISSSEGSTSSTEGSTSSTGPTSPGVDVARSIEWHATATVPTVSSPQDMGAVVVGDRVLMVIAGRLGDDVQIVSTGLDGSDVRNAGPSPLDGRAQPSIVWTGEEIVVAGGASGAEIVTFGAAYSPSTDSWREIVDPAVLDDGAWLLRTGSWTGEEIVWWEAGVAYDPTEDSWREIAPFPGAPRMEAAVAVVDGRVVVWGGCDGECEGPPFPSDYPDGAVYDPDADVWSPLPDSSLTSGVAAVAVADASGVTFVAGEGTDGVTTRAARYDLESETWTELPDPPLEVQRYLTGHVLAGDEGLLVGGGPGAASAGRGEFAVFHPSSGRWSAPLAGPTGAPLNAVVTTPRGIVSVDPSGQVWSGAVIG